MHYPQTATHLCTQSLGISTVFIFVFKVEPFMLNSVNLMSKDQISLRTELDMNHLKKVLI